MDALRKRQQNKATVAYYLMLDNRRHGTCCFRVVCCLAAALRCALAQREVRLARPKMKDGTLSTTECAVTILQAQHDALSNVD